MTKGRRSIEGCRFFWSFDPAKKSGLRPVFLVVERQFGALGGNPDTANVRYCIDQLEPVRRDGRTYWCSQEHKLESETLAELKAAVWTLIRLEGYISRFGMRLFPHWTYQEITCEPPTPPNQD